MGEYHDNKKQGNGTFFYPDGSKYEGEMFNCLLFKLCYYQAVGLVINEMAEVFIHTLMVTRTVGNGVTT